MTPTIPFQIDYVSATKFALGTRTSKMMFAGVKQKIVPQNISLHMDRIF